MKCIQVIKGKHRVNGVNLNQNYQCRKCLPCLVTRRQEWTARLLLEMKYNLRIYYVTLTYNQVHLPPRESLSRKDLRNFLKRLRKNTNARLRYFACGEYGDKSGRPHYHILFFTNDVLRVEYGRDKRREKKRTDRFSIGGDFHSAWSSSFNIDFNPITGRCNDKYPFELGIVDVRELAFADDIKRVAAYVCGYVLKKIGKEKCLPGKESEFQVMSKKPGLGVPFVENFVRNLKGHGIGPRGYEGVAIEHDLQMIRIHGKLYPFHRTLREKAKEYYNGEPSALSKALRNHIKAFLEQIEEDKEEYEAAITDSKNKAEKAYKKYLRSRLG